MHAVLLPLIVDSLASTLDQDFYVQFERAVKALRSVNFLLCCPSHECYMVYVSLGPDSQCVLRGESVNHNSHASGHSEPLAHCNSQYWIILSLVSEICFLYLFNRHIPGMKRICNVVKADYNFGLLLIISEDV